MPWGFFAEGGLKRRGYRPDTIAVGESAGDLLYQAARGSGIVATK